jgi:hypothetical protein
MSDEESYTGGMPQGWTEPGGWGTLGRLIFDRGTG